MSNDLLDGTVTLDMASRVDGICQEDATHHRQHRHKPEQAEPMSRKPVQCFVEWQNSHEGRDQTSDDNECPDSPKHSRHAGSSGDDDKKDTKGDANPSDSIERRRQQQRPTKFKEERRRSNAEQTNAGKAEAEQGGAESQDLHAVAITHCAV